MTLSKLSKGQKKFKNLPKNFIYLNNGTEGSMPKNVLNSFKKNLLKWTTNPTIAYETDPNSGKGLTKTRKKIAKFLNVQHDNICLTENTSMGLNMVLMGLDFQANDKVIITDHEHGAVTSPLWFLKEKQGIEVVIQKFPEPEILQKMSSDELLDHLFPINIKLQYAKAICVSHVYCNNGVRLPLNKLRQRVKELGISYLIVDGAQSMGMLDVNDPENHIYNCDFYAAPFHKWMNGPPGTGVLYIRNANLAPPEFYPTMTQITGSYLYDTLGDFVSVADALQVRGCLNVPAYLAITKLTEFYEDVGGMGMVENHIFALSNSVKKFLTDKSPCCLISPMDEELHSGVICFYPFKWDEPETIFKDKETLDKVNNELFKKGIQVRWTNFPTVCGNDVKQTYCIRVSTGYFNTADDVETFKKTLKKVLINI